MFNPTVQETTTLLQTSPVKIINTKEGYAVTIRHPGFDAIQYAGSSLIEVAKIATQLAKG